jgi:DNA-binding transcriptional MerR regulator
MAPDDLTYTLPQLAALADVTPRTVRYYIAQGLLPAPTGGGPGAHYTDTHLDRLRLIKKLQRAHQPLAAIRAQVRNLDDTQVAALADSTTPPPPASSAVDYIRAVIGDGPPAARAMSAPAPRAWATRALVGRAPDEPRFVSAVRGPDRSQWERVSLTPDIELHIRRPLTRDQNKRVDRLIAIARELLEEDQP